MFQDGDIGEGLYLFDQLVQNFCTGCIFVVENPVTGVAAFQCPVQLAVRSPVKVYAHIQDGLNFMCGMCGQNVYRFRVILETAGNHRVMLMQLNGVSRRVVHTGDTALRQVGIAQRQILFAQQQNPAV